MNVSLRKFGVRDYFRILGYMLNREYSCERENTFFQYLTRGLKSVRQNDSYEFAILSDGKFAGNIGIIQKEKDQELGYWVLKKFRSKGVATRAVKEITAIAFKELGFTEIIAMTSIENVPSQKVLKKNKFKIIKRDKKNKELLWRLRK